MSTTATYYIKTAADDVRAAMTKLEEHILEPKFDVQDTIGTPNIKITGEPSTLTAAIWIDSPTLVFAREYCDEWFTISDVFVP